MKMDNTNSIKNNQYSLTKIISMWLLAAAPMGILAYVATPVLAPGFESDPLGASFIRLSLITEGLIWQFILSLIIIHREEGNISWSTIRERLNLNTPKDPKTGKPSRKLWLWAIPFILLLFGVIYSMIGPTLDTLWVSIFPILAPTVGSNLNEVLGSTEIQTQVVGNWLFVGLFLILALFNILGEEFIFRGVLLSKMEGVFGKFDWVVNGVLMGAYHWHQPWTIPGAALASVICFSFPAKRFKSTYLAMIIHGFQFVLVLPGIISLVLGLGP
jgi:membrane protease YdiL (CAAX protease family)